MPGVTQSWVWVLVRIVLLAVLAGLLVIVATSASTAANRDGRKSPVKCPPVHARILLADTSGVIYEALPGHPPFPAINFPAIYGCTYGHRTFELGEALRCGGTSCLGVDHEVLAGQIVAYEYFGSAEESQEWFVVVRDIRGGHILRRLPTGTRIKPVLSKIGIGHITTIVVKTDGSVAWIVETNAEEGTYQVHAVDKTGNRTLATGADIAPHSLALVGSTLYWTQGGKPFSAPLD